MKRIGIVLVAGLMAFGMLCGCDAGLTKEDASSEWLYITASSSADKTTTDAETTVSTSDTTGVPSHDVSVLTTTSAETKADTTATTSADTSTTVSVTTTASTTKKPIVTTTTTTTATTTVRRTTSTTRRTTTTTVRTTIQVEPQGDMVWIPNSGKKYHCRSSCSGMKAPSYVTRQEAIRLGYEPCKRCY